MARSAILLKSNVVNILLLFERTILPENNFIQMAASAGHVVAYTIGPIFKNIIDCNGLSLLIFEEI